MRYGKEQKDYFWIISSSPVMIMHPYRSDLNGKDMSNFADNHENKLFVDAARLVKEKGEGTLEYYWQWKDDASKIVPKLSYVKGFEDWNWVIGTGIYLEDVRLEIKNLKKSLLKVSFVIILLMLIIFFYILRQSKAIEDKRVKAEEQLRLSIQKYKSLVDASTEGTLMLVNGKVVFSNIKFISFLKDENVNLIGAEFSKLFRKNWDEMVSMITNPKKTYTFETELLNAKAGMQNVVISLTQISQSGRIGYIMAVKNVTENKRLRLDAQKISDDIQLSLQLMNQPVHNLINKNVTCSLSDTISDVAKMMTDNRSKLICVKEKEDIIGVVTDTDLRRRVLAKNEDADKPIYSVMSSR